MMPTLYPPSVRRVGMLRGKDWDSKSESIVLKEEINDNDADLDGGWLVSCISVGDRIDWGWKGLDE